MGRSLAGSSATVLRRMAPADQPKPLHILVLADRDWTHHDTGGNGANIEAQVSRWVEWGNRVTVVTGSYPGAERVEYFGPRLTVHRAGNRATVFPRAFLTVMRGVGKDADVVVEVINGITFLTPLWLRKPRVAMVHHVHRELFIGEFGLAGHLLYWLAEKLPLSTLYRRTPFVTISNAARADLTRDGIPYDHITVEYLGVDPDKHYRGKRAQRPRIIFVGRLKAYKRVEVLLDVLEAIPEAGPGRGRGGRSPARPRTRDRPPRPCRPRGHARLRGPRAKDRALRARVAQHGGVSVRGLVADGDGSRHVRHAERGPGGWRTPGVGGRRRDRPACAGHAGVDPPSTAAHRG